MNRILWVIQVAMKVAEVAKFVVLPSDGKLDPMFPRWVGHRWVDRNEGVTFRRDRQFAARGIIKGLPIGQAYFEMPYSKLKGRVFEGVLRCHHHEGAIGKVTGTWSEWNSLRLVVTLTDQQGQLSSVRAFELRRKSWWSVW